MKCWICNKKIKISKYQDSFTEEHPECNNIRHDEQGYAHDTCVKAQSKLTLRPLNVESFIFSSGHAFSKTIVQDIKEIIDKNTLGEINI